MSTLPESKLKKFKQRFEELDINGTGSLTRETVAQILEEEGNELERLMVIILFEKYDSNKDQLIQLDEYLNFCTEMYQLSDKEILRKIFDFCDKDHNEKLDLNEVVMLGRQMGKNVTESDASATIRALDANHDNTIDFEEFCAIIN
ncbi:EF hand family protein [Trichomonas vaginalis G3]|uniref:EF hand family protein n=1 Tax=Trichomonas vaginalis (strain ATCC PRA-98 / G3) TaxID=412133 RepID=A2FQ58_TRIV3|nr:calcium-binding protein family [Trichomonas vaginalis G3]EAX92965.1 EF hand family protein [Trichomonas vaginalis G3]KAI5512354.1 calcium-binding protein family [Trichomonas vaginalis G3]|eukprot:XP_001305895.1 EF hand family protein [Trichomonas vaginalis G3]